MRGAEWRGAKGKNWDNYNSIINKILFKMKKSCPIEKNKLMMYTVGGIIIILLKLRRFSIPYPTKLKEELIE